MAKRGTRRTSTPAPRRPRGGVLDRFQRGFHGQAEQRRHQSRLAPCLPLQDVVRGAVIVAPHERGRHEPQPDEGQELAKALVPPKYVEHAAS